MAVIGIDFMADDKNIQSGKITTVADELKKIPQLPPSPEAWSVRELRGLAAEVIEQIKNYTPLTAEEKKAGKAHGAKIHGSIPDEDKEWIIRKIEKSGFQVVSVSAHEHFHEGVTMMHGVVGKIC